MARAEEYPPSDPRSSMTPGARKRTARVPAAVVHDSPTITPAELIPYAAEQSLQSPSDPRSTISDAFQRPARMWLPARADAPTTTPCAFTALAAAHPPPS